jgi:2,3-bisphosphoglycerate-dependent phosphoglycerate mutase
VSDPERFLTLLRHGQSTWNAENRFTGWTDVDLSKLGVAEAHAAACLLHRDGYAFDVAFTSVLKRAIRTLWIIQDDLDCLWLPIRLSWRLNERHYGALQGLDKAETAARFGDEQVLAWRRSYGTRPPTLEPGDPRAPGLDRRYAGLSPDQLPVGESLEDTVSRVLPCWTDEIAPALAAGERVLIVAHGNSLRALAMYLDGLSEDEVAALDIPTGVPLVYRLDDRLRPLGHAYLGDPAAIREAVTTARSATGSDSGPAGGWPRARCRPRQGVPRDVTTFEAGSHSSVGPGLVDTPPKRLR